MSFLTLKAPPSARHHRSFAGSSPPPHHPSTLYSTIVPRESPFVGKVTAMSIYSCRRGKEGRDYKLLIRLFYSFSCIFYTSHLFQRRISRGEYIFCALAKLVKIPLSSWAIN